MTETRISRRSFGALSLGAVAMAAGARFVVAQDATPMASPAAPSTIFSGLEEKLPMLKVEVQEFTFAIKNPGCLAEGWYQLVVNNSSKATVATTFAMVPEGQSVGDLTSVVAKAFKGEGGELPAWWSSAKFAGGAAADAGQTSSSLVYLTPGKWALINTNPASKQSPASIEIQDAKGLVDTGCAEAPAEGTPAASPAASPVAETTTGPAGIPFGMTVDITDTAFVPTASPIPGDLVMKVTNSGEQPHDLIVLKTNTVTDLGAATSMAQSWLKGEQVDATVAGGVGALSKGQSAFTEIQVEPATYVAFSSFPDANGGLQIDKGLVTVFSAQ